MISLFFFFFLFFFLFFLFFFHLFFQFFEGFDECHENILAVLLGFKEARGDLAHTIAHLRVEDDLGEGVYPR